MRLSEALIQRADIRKRIGQLQTRLARSVRVQEGEQPPEDPQELLQELERLITAFTKLAARINLTNSQTPFDDTRMLTEALAERDANVIHRHILEGIIKSATNIDGSRGYQVATVKTIRTINVRDTQANLDALARRYRELDTRIQELNWTTELIE